MTGSNSHAGPSEPVVPRNRFLIGDALEQMRRLPAGSVDCVVTSPPYFRLRDYGATGQLGLEEAVDDWVESLRQVTRQIARVLVPTGTVWLNLGDSYSTHRRQGAPPKSLLAAPERLLLALMDDGWLVRNKVVWAKTNPIPSSVRDRLACHYEVVYLLVRRPRYFFDLDAIRIPAKTPLRRPVQPGRPTAPTGRSVREGSARPAWLGPNTDSDGGLLAMRQAGLSAHPLGKNPGDVWQLATARFGGEHFASFPEELVRPMIRAGVPERRCQVCQVGYRRGVRRLGAAATRLALRPGCGCGAGSEPGLVLDPFMGVGTTALVAEAEGRDWLGIELSPKFARLASERLNQRRHARQGPQPRGP